MLSLRAAAERFVWKLTLSYRESPTFLAARPQRAHASPRQEETSVAESLLRAARNPDRMKSAVSRAGRRMQDLADQPGVTVLEYAYEEQTRRAPPDKCCGFAREVFLLRRREYSCLSDVQAGKAITEASAILREFSASHPRIFANVLNLEIGARCVEVLERLARIRQEADASGMTEEEALVHANRIIMERTMREPTEKERAELVPTEKQKE